MGALICNPVDLELDGINALFIDDKAVFGHDAEIRYHSARPGFSSRQEKKRLLVDGRDELVGCQRIFGG